MSTQPSPDKVLDEKHYCTQCGEDMGFEWIMGPICGKCCKANHRQAMGKGPGRGSRRQKSKSKSKELT